MKILQYGEQNLSFLQAFPKLWDFQRVPHFAGFGCQIINHYMGNIRSLKVQNLIQAFPKLQDFQRVPHFAGFWCLMITTIWGTFKNRKLDAVEFDLGIPQIVGFSESSPLRWILVSGLIPLYGEHLSIRDSKLQNLIQAFPKLQDFKRVPHFAGFLSWIIESNLGNIHDFVNLNRNPFIHYQTDCYFHPHGLEVREFPILVD